MNFKKLSLLFLSAFFFVSCSEFLKGNKKKDEVIELKKDEFACLDQAADTLRDVMSESSSAEKIEESLSCVITSLEYFKKKTKGSKESPDTYTTQNIRSFFGKYLGDRNRVSDEMAAQMMRLKAALLGGQEKFMNKNELQGLIEIISQIRAEVKNLRPHWDLILAKNPQEEADSVSIRAANQALQRSLLNLISYTQLSSADYTFHDFKSLLGEMEDFAHKSPQQASVQIRTWIPLMESVKSILFGEVAEMNSSARWRDAISMVTELHRLYLLYKYQYEKFDVYSKQGLKVGDEVLVLLIQLLDRSWVLQKTGIPFETTQKLFEALKKQSLLPESVSARGITQTYRSIVLNVLERELRNPQDSLTGLERRHVNVLKSEYEVWKTAQNFIDEMPEQFSYAQIEEKLKNYKPKFNTQFATANPEILKSSWDDWLLHLHQERPILYMPTGEIIISSDVKNISNWPWYSLARMNVMRTLSRVLMLGYGIKRTMILKDERLQERSMSKWYDDNNILGVEIKAFDPRNVNSGARSFFESDHFLYSSNGDGYMDRQEAFEFVNLIFSSGLSGLKTIQTALGTSKCQLPEKDAFGKHWSNEDCFKKMLRQNFTAYFRNLIGLKKFVSQMDDDQWAEFYKELISFSRRDANVVGKVETSDIQTLVVILHYIESLYVTFDTNHDDRLSKDELKGGSGRFVEFFKAQYGLSAEDGGIKDWAYDAAITKGFACMVLSGKMPGFWSCSWVFAKDAWEDRYSDRLKILKTLNQFRAQIR